MLHRAVEHVGDGLEAAVRVVGRALRLTRTEIDRAHVVEEQERVDLRERRGRERPPHLEPSTFELTDRRDDRLDRALARTALMLTRLTLTRQPPTPVNALRRGRRANPRQHPVRRLRPTLPTNGRTGLLRVAADRGPELLAAARGAHAVLRARRALRRLRARRVRRGARTGHRPAPRVGHRPVPLVRPAAVGHGHPHQRGRARPPDLPGPGRRLGRRRRDPHRQRRARATATSRSGRVGGSTGRAAARGLPAAPDPGAARGHDHGPHRDADRRSPAASTSSTAPRATAAARSGSGCPGVLEMSAAASLAIVGDYVPFGISQALGHRAGGNSLDNTLARREPRPDRLDPRRHPRARGRPRLRARARAPLGRRRHAARHRQPVHHRAQLARGTPRPSAVPAPSRRRRSDDDAATLGHHRPVRRRTAQRAPGLVRGARGPRLHRHLVERSRRARRVHRARARRGVDAGPAPRPGRRPGLHARAGAARADDREPHRGRARTRRGRARHVVQRDRRALERHPVRTAVPPRARHAALPARRARRREGDRDLRHVRGEGLPARRAGGAAAADPRRRAPPGMLRLAGREGDGAIINWLSADDVRTVAPIVRAGGGTRRSSPASSCCRPRTATRSVTSAGA